MNDAISKLSTPSNPFLTIVSSSNNVARMGQEWRDAALMVAEIQGDSARTLPEFFSEIASSLSFPIHFGHNWAALRDCISDLDSLSSNGAIVLVIFDSNEVLVDAHSSELQTFVHILAETAREFQKPVDVGEWWDRGPVPLHVVLQAESIADFDPWVAAGATLTGLLRDQ